MSDLDTVLDPSRSAHASIQGYLYQAYLGVERWLELKEDEVLRCEGDEDLDRLLRDGSGGWSEQVKAYTGDVNIRDEVVQDTLRRFLVSHHRLRTGDKPDLRRFLFTSTATRRRQVTDERYPVDVLAVWEEAKEDGAVRSQVVGVLRTVLPLEETADRPASRRFAEQVRAALAWLDGDAERWADLIGSLEWRLGEPQLTEVRGKIDQALNHVRPGAPPNLRDRLLSEVLDASIAPDPRDRCRTREQLVALLDQAEAEVARWLATARGYGLVKRLEELDDLRGILVDKPQDLPPSPRPGQLLTAAYEVIPFDETGREEILNDLAGWCADSRLRLVRLIHGDGGLGKTRLLIEWCRRLAAQGWLTGFLLPVATPDELPRLLQGTLPRLVVIDYAETRLEAVRALVMRLAYLKDGPKVRLVLLARREGDWWESLKKDAATEDLLDSTPPRDLPRLLPGLEERRQAFRTAAHAFAQHLLYRTGIEGAKVHGAVDPREVDQREVELGVVVPPPLGGRAVGSGGGQEGGSSRRGLAPKPPTRGEDTQETRRLSPPQSSPPPNLPHSLPRPLPGGEAPPP
ncbi:MAG TPA: hypothetical protein VEL74_13425, partial [Thermoanaerobaculia bacterium]|nr:hypothetical protein [Thermoanaerobaculia bacterium]